MIRVLAVALLCAAPMAAAAQSPSRLTVQAGGVAAAYDAQASGGALRYGAAALGRLGARFEESGPSLRVFLFGDTLLFEAGSPFFRDNQRVRQLVDAVSGDTGGLMIPAQFFTEWLPARFPQQLAYSDGTLRARMDVARTEPSRVAHQDTQRVASADARLRTDTQNEARPKEHTPPDTQRTVHRRPTIRPDSQMFRPPVPLPMPSVDSLHVEGGNVHADARVVVLDAGHGGRDSGKIGPNGLREKTVTLQISQRVAALLRARGYEVHLTRTTDTLISLADRPRFANKWKAGRPAALYVSVHANAGETGARGFETYFLSDARTEDERRVAEMENAAISYEDHTGGADLSETDRILNNLRNDYYIKASDDLAEVVQQRLRAFHPGPNRGVKRAGFRVLVGAIMPAILVETAFISNPGEARLLGTPAFQQRLAFAITDAIDSFFNAHEHLWAAAQGSR